MGSARNGLIEYSGTRGNNFTPSGNVMIDGKLYSGHSGSGIPAFIASPDNIPTTGTVKHYIQIETRDGNLANLTTAPATYSVQTGDAQRDPGSPVNTSGVVAGGTTQSAATDTNALLVVTMIGITDGKERKESLTAL